ncbi:ATPase [Embleya hyalina]|uniref:ATPase n=2 Tax=Embleya hyalina TaxID=516124 RepID=A0A401YQ36_9ACTN|nr:ATPase [Embleya hyalina]
MTRFGPMINDRDMAVAGSIGSSAPVFPDLSDLERWIADVLARAVQANGPESGESSLERLYPSHGEVRAALAGAPRPAPVLITGPPLPAHLALPLARRGFDPFDLAALALILAPELDPAYGRAIAWLQRDSGQPYPTLDLLARLCCETGEDRAAVAVRLSAAGPLLRCGLVEPVGGRPGPSYAGAVRPSAVLLRRLFAISRLDDALAPFATVDAYTPVEAPDPIAAEALVARLVGDAPSLTHLSGAPAATCLDVAWWSVARAGRRVLTVRPEALADPALLPGLAAEALLREAVLVVDTHTGGPPDAVWDRFTYAVVVGGPDTLAPTGPDVPAERVAALSVRRAVGVPGGLATALAAHGVEVASTPGADPLAGWTHLAGPELRHTLDAVAARARGRAEPGAPLRTTATEVADVAARITGGELGRLATRLGTSDDWSALIVPDDVGARLRDVCAHLSAHRTVLDAPGFADRPGLGRGVSVLFAGPSGTGKTLAARLVAGRLGLPLYRVDLASVVSKYIGETEQNLDAVFTAAARTDAVLLFDECDALFGKRSEVHDARDRYANLEVAYLLQRLEDHDGLAVLATNLLHHMDDAFIRRLTYCVHFPFPEAAERRRIWQGAWPAALPRDVDVDPAELAEHYPLSGGHIHNVAVAAAHLAAAEGRAVDRAVVLRAMEREYDKIGPSPQAPATIGAR